MNVQALKALYDDVKDDIIVKKDTLGSVRRKVQFECYHWQQNTKLFLHMDSSIEQNDVRILTAAIKRLKPKQLSRLSLTRDELMRIVFTRGTSAGCYKGDSRYLTMSPEEVDVQRALGINDPKPMSVYVSGQYYS